MNILLIALGIAVVYLSAVIKYVNAPYKWVIEFNFPGRPTTKIVWEPGLHFLWFPINPFMFVKNKLFCADKKILLTIGVDDGNPGNPSLVEFKDTSAAVRTLVILKVIDPIKATYEIDDYEGASLDKIEANFRKILSGLKLDDAMGNVDRRTEITTSAFQDANTAIAKWGVALTNPGGEITIIDFVLGKETLDDRAKVLKAEKDYDAQIKKASATKEETILLKTGEAQGIKLIRDAEGKGEADKVKLLADHLGLPTDKAIEYLLRLGMLKSIEGSTIIATSEGGYLNTPIGFAQTMFAIDSARTHTKGGNKA